MGTSSTRIVCFGRCRSCRNQYHTTRNYSRSRHCTGNPFRTFGTRRRPPVRSSPPDTHHFLRYQCTSNQRYIECTSSEFVSTPLVCTSRHRTFYMWKVLQYRHTKSGCRIRYTRPETESNMYRPHRQTTCSSRRRCIHDGKRRKWYGSLENPRS
jgi:hypothetical protein